MRKIRQFVKFAHANIARKKNAPGFEGKKPGAKILISNTSMNERG
jgi:hypothetical protein